MIFFNKRSVAARYEKGRYERSILTYVFVHEGLSTNDVRMAKGTVFPKIGPWDGFKTGSWVKEKLGGANVVRLYGKKGDASWTGGGRGGSGREKAGGEQVGGRGGNGGVGRGEGVGHGVVRGGRRGDGKGGEGVVRGKEGFREREVG